MQIPKQFKLGGVRISVEIVDTIEDGACFGKFFNASQKILLAKRVSEDEELVNVSDELMSNTFYHELTHAFQAYYNCEYDEIQAQCFANLFMEYNNSVIF